MTRLTTKERKALEAELEFIRQAEQAVEDYKIRTNPNYDPRKRRLGETSPFYEHRMEINYKLGKTKKLPYFWD